MVILEKINKMQPMLYTMYDDAFKSGKMSGKA